LILPSSTKNTGRVGEKKKENIRPPIGVRKNGIGLNVFRKSMT
jgi:hypothetical protein